MNTKPDMNTQVRAFWEQGPCGTNIGAVGDAEPMSREWLETVEHNRYTLEPMIHGAAQFTRHCGANPAFGSWLPVLTWISSNTVPRPWNSSSIKSTAAPCPTEPDIGWQAA
jgi:hypothetical protein